MITVISFNLAIEILIVDTADFKHVEHRLFLVGFNLAIEILIVDTLAFQRLG